MKSELSSGQQASILLLTLSFHLLLLIIMFVLQQHHSAQEHHLNQEPIILIEKEPQTTITPPLPKHDWVSMASSPPSLVQSTPAISPSNDHQVHESDEPSSQEQPEEKSASPVNQNIADALSIAQQVLASKDSTITIDSEIEKKIQQKTDDIPKNINNEVKKSTQPSQQNITFAQLAQGFNQHMQASLSVKSDKQGTPSVDQIKHLNFCQKILTCLVNSYHIHQGNMPLNKIMNNTVLIQLVLNQDGSIHTLNILQSSNNPSIDRFLLHMFQDASSSFPPVPASFEKPYQLPLFNFDRIEVFQSTNYWHIDTHKS
jgi:TonB family protein